MIEKIGWKTPGKSLLRRKSAVGSVPGFNITTIISPTSSYIVAADVQ